MAVSRFKPGLGRRESSRGGSVGLWAARLFALPHTLVGLYLLLMMIVGPLWVVAGRDTQRPVARVWEECTRKGNWICKLSVRDEASGEEKGERQIPRAEFDRVLRAIEASPEAPVTVAVRRLGIGKLAFERPVLEGESGWGQIAFYWPFGLFWNAILSVFIYSFYWAPFREWRLRRRGPRFLYPRSSKGN